MESLRFCEDTAAAVRVWRLEALARREAARLLGMELVLEQVEGSSPLEREWLREYIKTVVADNLRVVADCIEEDMKTP